MSLESVLDRAITKDRIMFANGFAANDDRIKEIWTDATKELELISAKLNKTDHGWESHWSRRWEFPWAFRAVSSLHPPQEILSLVRSGKILTALEAGSGFTEFPFWLAANGWAVTGTDLDPTCEAKWAEMVRGVEFPSVPPTFQIANMERLEFSDNFFDMAYSISALEHTAKPAKAVSEMIRVVRPGGTIMFTCDVRCQGRYGIDRADFEEIESRLANAVVPALPSRHVLPAALLTSTWKQRALDGMLRSSVKSFLSNLGLYTPNDFTVFAFLGKKR